MNTLGRDLRRRARSARGYALACASGLAVGTTACSEPRPETGCTAIGSSSVLRVRVTSVDRNDSVHVDAAARGMAPRVREAGRDTASGDCAGPRCADGLFLDQFAPDTAVLTLTTAGRRDTHVVAPRYRLDHPNGPDCPDPTVRVGTVTLPVPRRAPGG